MGAGPDLQLKRKPHNGTVHQCDLHVQTLGAIFSDQVTGPPASGRQLICMPPGPAGLQSIAT